MKYDISDDLYRTALADQYFAVTKHSALYLYIRILSRRASKYEYPEVNVG
jgi:hypothetical protein